MGFKGSYYEKFNSWLKEKGHGVGKNGEFILSLVSLVSDPKNLLIFLDCLYFQMTPPHHVAMSPLPVFSLDHLRLLSPELSPWHGGEVLSQFQPPFLNLQKEEGCRN